MKCVFVDFRLHCAMVGDGLRAREGNCVWVCFQVQNEFPLNIIPNVQGWEGR